MATTAAEIIDVVKYEIDDPEQTSFDNDAYVRVLERAARFLFEMAYRVNKSFLQYSLGELRQASRCVMESKATGTVTYPADSGTANVLAGGSATELQDLDKIWVEDEWDGYTLIITGGTGIGETFTIVSNTTCELTVGGPWVVQPDATSTYEIRTPATDKLYDSGLTSPWADNEYPAAFVKITAGTAVGQEREISAIKGYEITVATDWSTAPANADSYAIIGPQKDFTLPADMFRPFKVKVNGKEIGRKRPSSSEDYANTPAFSFVGTSLRVDFLGGGELVELFYNPTWTPIAAVGSTMPLGDDFKSFYELFTTMVLKGRNEKNMQQDGALLAAAQEGMMQFMTDINTDENMEITSHWEDFKS